MGTKRRETDTVVETAAKMIVKYLRQHSPTNSYDMAILLFAHWTHDPHRLFRRARRFLWQQGKPVVSVNGKYMLARKQRDIEAAARAHQKAALTMLRDAARLLKVPLPGMLRQMALQETMDARKK